MYALPALITALALLFYSFVTFKTGMARGKYGIKAPAISGHEMFERRYRVQANTLEQLMLFLPSLWLFTFFQQAPKVAACIGAVWLIGRSWYAVMYYRDPSKRAPGFIVALFSSIILLIGGLAGICVELTGSF